MGKTLLYVVVGIIAIIAVALLIQNNGSVAPQAGTALQTPVYSPSPSNGEIIPPENSVQPSTSATPSTGQNAIKRFTITGNPNFSFTPDTINVKEGDTVIITFVDSGGTHSLAIDAFNVKTDTLQAGQQQTVQFVANKKGTFEFHCPVGNHRQLGMVGTLSVE